MLTSGTLISAKRQRYACRRATSEPDDFNRGYVRKRIDYSDEDLERLSVMIRVESPKGYISGGEKVVQVKTLGLGFDWNSGQLIIYPEKLLEEKK